MENIKLKTGFDIVEDLALDTNTSHTIVSLLSIFQEDALITAGQYTIGCGRKNVKAIDMKKALMFQAKYFFEQGDTLDTKFSERMRDLEENNEESDEEESGSEEESGGEEEEESGDEEESDEEESDEEEEKSDEEQTKVTDAEKQKYASVVANVDRVYNEWDDWNPTDPILCTIKRSINAVSCPDE
tara:strand:+ start:143 stop:700 length:558 start_codon:yes stop_codon:yes gene_type:complete